MKHLFVSIARYRYMLQLIFHFDGAATAPDEEVCGVLQQLTATVICKTPLVILLLLIHFSYPSLTLKR